MSDQSPHNPSTEFDPEEHALEVQQLAEVDAAKLMIYRQMRDRRCQSKKELQEWLRTYLGMDFPDYTLDPESNCNPMDMVWMLYKNMVHWHRMKPDRRATKFLFYATRGGFKTLAAAVVELMALIHDNRGTAHIAAGESHVKHCYNDYFQPLVKLPIIKERIKSTIMEKTVSAQDERASVEIMPCTKKRTQGPHQSLVCLHSKTKVLVESFGKRRRTCETIAKVHNEHHRGNPIKVYSYDLETGRFEFQSVVSANKSRKMIYAITCESGKVIKATNDHRFYVWRKGYVQVEDFVIGDCLIKLGRRRSNSEHIEQIEDVQFERGSDKSQDFLEQFLIGGLLGDLGIFKKKSNNAYVYATHSKSQKDYAIHKMDVLKFYGFAAKYREQRGGYKDTLQSRIISGNNSRLNGYLKIKGDDFNGFVDKLGVVGLTYWYCDDGEANGFGISTHGFDEEKVRYLSSHINLEFGFCTRVVFVKGKYWQIKGTIRDKVLLHKICKKWIPESMTWKFDISKHISNCRVCGKETYKFDLHTATVCREALCQHLKLGGLKFDPIKSVRQIEVATVYDIGVEKNNNFFANGVLVHNCKDEIDVVQDVSAYADIDGIPVNMPDGRPPITFGISVRKSSFGLVQKEIDEAPKKGVKVYHWNLIDITERCTPERYGKHKIPIYVKKNTLIAVGQSAYDRLDFSEQKEYELHEGWDGCLSNCKLFAACRGLLPHQRATSKWLKGIDYTQQKFFESADEEMAIAQFLCRKPPATGLIYPDYSTERNEKTYTEMWEIFFKTKAPREITREDLVQQFHKHQIPCYFGVDWGFDPDPTVVLVVFIDNADNHYVVDEFVCWRTSEAEVAFWLSDNANNENWQRKYNPQLVYPDLSHPGGRKELEKVGFMCAGPKRMKTKMQRHGQKDNVIKDVKPGISSIRRLIRVPGSQEGKLFINRQACPTLCFEISRYHNKVDESGKVVSDTPADRQPDHTCFVPGTMIATKFGWQPIQNIRKNDTVKTGKGYRRVLDTAITGYEDVYEFTFSNGLSFIATKDHPVITRSGEAIQAKNLVPWDGLVSLSKWQMRIRNLMGRLKLGGGLLKPAHGIVMPQNQRGLAGSTGIEGVKSAIKHSAHGLASSLSFVRTIVSRRIAGNRERMTLSENVSGVATFSPQGALQAPYTAEGNAPHIISMRYVGRSLVWNITVESCHQYYANGVLVSNCDALRYLVHSMNSQGITHVELDSQYQLGVTGQMNRAPTPEEVGAMMGLPIIDNSNVLTENSGENGDSEDSRDDDGNSGGKLGGGGFNFSF